MKASPFSEEFKARAAAARKVPTLETFTGGAMDALRIAAFAGFDTEALIKEVVLASNPQRKINAARVYNAMDRIARQHRAEKGDEQ